MGRLGDSLGLVLAEAWGTGCRALRGPCGLLPPRPASSPGPGSPRPPDPLPRAVCRTRPLQDEVPSSYRSSRLRLNMLPCSPPETRGGSPTSAALGRHGAREQEPPPLLPGGESAPCAPPRLPGVSVATRRAPLWSRAGQEKPEGIGLRDHRASSFSAALKLS